MGQSEKMEQEDNRPKWLMELENRKRKPRLAHEVGAGAPCMKCNTACPGLDLHFWRKICKNCKCSRDDHDVPNDDFPQFDLLFGPSGKANRKMIVLKVNKKQAEAEMTFEWAPPDTTKELAADYMKALPEDKLPIKGTAGAVLRKQQLARQLPLHDIDHKVCDELSESERKQFEKYLENLKKYVGQGKVTKALGARPFDISLMTPANATDMNRFSPKHKQTPEIGRSLNLRTPSSFVQKTTFPSSLSSSEVVNGLRNRGMNSLARDQSPSSTARMESVRSPAFGTSSNENSPQARYHHALANVRNNDSEILNSKPVGGTRNPPLHFATSNKILDSSYTSLGGQDESINSRLESSLSSQNADIARSDPVGGIYNPAVQFAAENMLPHENQTISSGHCENGGKSTNDTNQGLSYATSSTLSEQDQLADSKLHSSRFPKENLSSSSSIPGSYYSGANAQSEIDRLNKESFGADSELAKSREEENSLLAEQMLNEALLPPSAIHAADIIGSTLDQKGLSFIREKLTSKYSAKEEPLNLQGTARSREFSPNERKDQQANGAKSKLRRQGAFDKEVDRSDVIAAMRNQSGNKTSDEELSSENYEDAQPSSSGINNLSEVQERLADPHCGQMKDNHFPGSGAFKENSGHEPWRQIYQGIWNIFLAKPGHSSEMQQRRNDSSFDKDISVNAETAYPSERIKYELSSYGPGNSNIIRSEDLHNPVFPEEAIVSSGIVQNPVSVDRLRGAMEEMNLNQGKIQNCHQCQENIRAGDVVVTAEKASESVWHPGCFVCSVCNELLADLVYFYYKGKLYCGRDLATLLEIPRCFACDELIFVREYTVAEGHNYHVKHFCCWDCDVPLAGQQYISENDRPLCLPCYQKTYAKTCRTCEGVIAADQQGVAVKNLNFHATEECFCCATCRKSLLNGKMAIKEDRPFCSKECITKFLNERPS